MASLLAPLALGPLLPLMVAPPLTLWVLIRARSIGSPLVTRPLGKLQGLLAQELQTFNLPMWIHPYEGLLGMTTVTRWLDIPSVDRLTHILAQASLKLVTFI